MEQNKMKKPFFASFLESQVNEEESASVQGGSTVGTLKYPTDSEVTSSVLDMYETKKYPSDSDEAVTQKYPSDGDDYVTMKAPSDSDEETM